MQRLPPISLFDQGNDIGKLLEGRNGRHYPFSDWLFDHLREPFMRSIPDDSRYSYAYDKFEMLIALSDGHQSIAEGERYWVPPGRYGYQRRSVETFQKELASSLDAAGNNSEYVKARLFGDTVTECRNQLARFAEFASQLNARW